MYTSTAGSYRLLTLGSNESEPAAARCLFHHEPQEGIDFMLVHIVPAFTRTWYILHRAVCIMGREHSRDAWQDIRIDHFAASLSQFPFDAIRVELSVA
jgi:hypothetical protein